MVYRGQPGDYAHPAWNSGTYREQCDYFLILQDDANLVVYRGQPRNYSDPVWSSKSYGVQGTYFLIVQDDGNLVIYRGTGPKMIIMGQYGQSKLVSFK